MVTKSKWNVNTIFINMVYLRYEKFDKKIGGRILYNLMTKTLTKINETSIYANSDEVKHHIFFFSSSKPYLNFESARSKALICAGDLSLRHVE